MLPAPPRPEEKAVVLLDDDDCDDGEEEEAWEEECTEGVRAVLVMKWVSGDASIVGGTGCVRFAGATAAKGHFGGMVSGWVRGECGGRACFEKL